MQVVPNKSKETQPKNGFDEQAKLQAKSLLDEIDRKQQSMYQNTETKCKTEYIKFGSDRERKVLFFTGIPDKKDVPAKDYETGLEIPGKYVTRYYFDCYDITTTRNPDNISGSPARWERGTRDARTILNFLSKGVSILEIVRNGPPGSMATTYQINPPLD
ncbi:MAG TPA: hypothetical protein VH796_01705 [Nitrososphaeraceae archaeon]|jgi:hypothetical protein